ncbi:hypothetical protein M2305_003249 [Gluconobacter cerinus]|uniref:hypothetical protein n=1 Tax=Gluconobacter cerinus TaxID=38307 RepID=UPI0022262945|nr:hypothetical protein [Gluconobacter cerinus]MCW2267230.1 hypothetical protein [Gluconobacter cerinus]
MSFKTWLFEIPEIYKSAWQSGVVTPSDDDARFISPQFPEGIYFQKDGVVIGAMCDGHCASDYMYEMLFVYKDATAKYQVMIGEQLSAQLSFKDALNPIIELKKADSKWNAFDGKNPSDPEVQKQLIETFNF